LRRRNETLFSCAELVCCAVTHGVAVVPLSSGANTLTPEGMEHLIPDSGTNRCPMRDSAPHPQKKNNNIKKKNHYSEEGENT